MATPQYELAETLESSLQEAYRCMIGKLVDGLTEKDCDKIVYIKKLPKDTCVPKPDKPSDIKLHVLIVLEGHGHNIIGPRKTLHLHNLLEDICRKDLKYLVEEYESKRSKSADKKKEKEKKKWRLKKKDKQADIKQPISSETSELLKMKDATNKEKLRKLQSLTLCLVGQLMQSAQNLDTMINNTNDEPLSKNKLTENAEVIIGETKSFNSSLRKFISLSGFSSGTYSNYSEFEESEATAQDEKVSTSPESHRHPRHGSLKATSKSRQPSSPAQTPVHYPPSPVVGLQPPQPLSRLTYHTHYVEQHSVEVDAAGVGRTKSTQRKPVPKPRTMIPKTSDVQTSPNADNGQAKGASLRVKVLPTGENDTDDNTGTGDSGIGDIASWIGPDHPLPGDLHDGRHQYKAEVNTCAYYEPLRIENKTDNKIQNEYTSPLNSRT